MSEAYAQHAEETKKHATKVLERVADAANAAGISCETVQLEHDQPYKAIITTAKHKDCDVIVWPRTGGAGFPRFYSGA
jgi:nucleotide-binding universal stress UspA family protein